jgi:hypothetical protein
MNAAEQQMEHRWGNRVSLDTPAAMRLIYDREVPVRIRDASVSGAFVETTDRPAPFSRIALRAISSSGDWIEAWVVRMASDGIGVEWLEPGSQRVLELILTHRHDKAGQRPRLAQGLWPGSISRACW